MKKPLILSLLFLHLLCACKPSETKQDVQHFSDSTRYILIDEKNDFDSRWSKENRVVYQWLAEPDLLHPNNGISAAKTELFLYLHSFLLLVDLRTLELTPVLAESLPQVSDDGLTVTFQLRQDARWDDGSAVTSDDVLFTIKAGKCPLTDNPHQKPVWNSITGFQKISNSRFSVRMKERYIHNVSLWVDLPIIQQSFYDPEKQLDLFTIEDMDKPDIRQHPTLIAWAERYNSVRYAREPEFISGAGPYRLSEWISGQTLTLSKKESHWSSAHSALYFQSRPDRIIFKIVRDPNAIMLELLSQQCDVSASLSTRSLLQLKDDTLFTGNYHYRFVDSFFFTYASMNNRPELSKRKGLFNNRQVRQAMALLTPVDEINRIVNKGMNKRMTGPVSFLKKDFNPALKPVPFQPEKARQILIQEGWTDSDKDGLLDKMTDGKKMDFEFSILYLTTVPEWRDMASLMADSYRKAGMKVELMAADYPSWLKAVQNLDYDMMLGSWGQSSLPDDFTQLWHSASVLSGGTNYSGFGNNQSDALIDSIKTELNDRRRTELSYRFQQLVYDEQPVIFLFASLRRMVVHKRFGKTELYYERPGILLSSLGIIQPASDAVQ